MDKMLQPRDRAYLDLLAHGLVFLHNFSFSGRVELWRIEAEHLHEILTLIHDANEQRHTYYLSGTREMYVQQLRELGEEAYLEDVAVWYNGPWRVLAEAAGATLTE